MCEISKALNMIVSIPLSGNTLLKQLTQKLDHLAFLHMENKNKNIKLG